MIDQELCIKLSPWACVLAGIITAFVIIGLVFIGAWSMKRTIDSSH